MTVRTPEYLKSRFEDGDIPQEADYVDVFDSYLPLLATAKQTLGIDLEITGTFSASAVFAGNASFDTVSASTIYANSISGIQSIALDTVSASSVHTNDLNVKNDIIVSGNVDGRNIATDRTKLDTIDTSAEVNPAVVTTAESQAGVVTSSRLWSPQNVKQAIDALAAGGGTVVPASSVTVSGRVAVFIDSSGKAIEDREDISINQVSASSISTNNLIVDTVSASAVNTDILSVGGDITVSGNVDGRDVSVDGTKLDTIESSAEVNPAFATTAEVNTGTNVSAVIAPATLNGRVATSAQSGLIEIATSSEVFNKDSSRALTGEGIYEAPFYHQWSSGNSDTGLGVLVPVTALGVSAKGYNLLTTFQASAESNASNIPLNFKDTAGSAQATLLVEATASSRFIFPSNLQTFNTDYIGYLIRVNITVDIGTTNNATTKFYIRLRRVSDNSIIFVVDFSQSDFAAESGVQLTRVIKTFVNSETDPFVVDGTYLDIVNDPNSSGTVTLQDVSIRIFRT